MAKRQTKVMGIPVGVLVAEFVGTLSLAMIVLVSINGVLAGDIATPVLAGVALGLAVMSIGAVSGAHINPGVTFGLLTAHKIKLNEAVGYWVVQVLGALAALGVLTALLDTEVLQVTQSVSDWTVFGGEVLGMTFFTFGVAAAVHRKMEGATAALLVGGSLFFGIAVAAIVSNGVLNPAVALAIGSASPAYIFGPLVGALLGNYLHGIMVHYEK